MNAYEIRPSAVDAGVRGLFALGSLLSHGCIANTVIVYEKEPPFKRLAAIILNETVVCFTVVEIWTFALLNSVRSNFF